MQANNRKSQRFDVQLPALFCWKNDGTRQKGEGITLDVSSNGILVESNLIPPLNTEVKMYLISTPTDERQNGITIYAKGRVVREAFVVGSGKRCFAFHSPRPMKIESHGVREAIMI